MAATCGTTERSCGSVNTTCMPEDSTCCGSKYYDGFFCEPGQHCEWTKFPSNMTFFETTYGLGIIPQCCPNGHFPCLVDSWMAPLASNIPSLPWRLPRKPTKCCRDGEVCVTNPRPPEPGELFPPRIEDSDITCHSLESFMSTRYWSDSDCVHLGRSNDILCGVNAHVPGSRQGLADGGMRDAVVIASYTLVGVAAIGAIFFWLWKRVASRSGPLSRTLLGTDTTLAKVSHLPTSDDATCTKERHDETRINSPTDRTKANDQSVPLWVLGIMLFAIASTLLAVSGVVFLNTRKNQALDPTFSTDSTPLFTGVCGDAQLKRYNMLSHLVLTMMGTVILASSAYAQKLCSSPTEEDILTAIAQGKDVRFGSSRPRSKVGLMLVWSLLFATSLPIHLVLNSATGWAVRPFETPNVFGVRLEDKVAADRNFRFEVYNGIQYDMTSIPWGKIQEWKRVTTAQCLEFVDEQNSFVLGYRNLAVVVADSSPISRAEFGWKIWADDDSKAFRVMEEVSFAKSWNATSTSLTADDISYCHVDLDLASCQVSVRWGPLLITGVLTLTKSVILFYSAWRVSHFRRRIVNSLGDVISLGAANPALHPVRLVIPDHHSLQGTSEVRTRTQVRPPAWTARKLRSLAPKPTLVDIVLLPCFIILVFVLVGKGAQGAHGLAISADDGFGISIGKMHRENFLSGVPSSFLNAAMITNLPQLAISLWYLCINAWVSKCWLEREWQSFYLKPRKIRLTTWQGEPGTRSTSWLQYPYWLTAILVLLSVATHWMGSQIYTPVEVLSRRVDPERNQGATRLVVNYSAPAVLILGITAGVATGALFAWWVVTAAERSWMPGLSGSCRRVLHYCTALRMPLPDSGVAWGDVSDQVGREGGETPAIAGFGASPGPIREGVEYETAVGEYRRQETVSTLDA